MAAKLSPVLNSQIFDANGNPLIGGTIETYLAGSSTPLNTFTDANGLITQTNPIVLNALGQSDNLIWLTSGSLYKFIVKDSLGNVQNTLDNIQGVNELVVNLDQWISSAITPTYINATTFSLSGDQTSIYQIGRRLRLSVTAGTLYGAVQSAIYGASTTVTVKLDSGVLDAGLSSLAYGILTPDNSSIPSIIEDYRQTIAATATTTPLWDAVGKIQDWTGNPTITALPNAPQEGSQRIVYPAAGTIITHAGNISVHGNASYTVQAGDELTITAITTTTFYVSIVKKDGLPVTILLKKYFSGFELSTAGASSTISVTSGMATDSTNAVMLDLSAAINKTTSSWAVGSGSGGLDTGTIANATWYHLYAIRRPDTGVVDAIFSTSASAPALPVNFTQYIYLGSAKTDGSAQWIKFTQIANNVLWDAAVIDVDAVNPGTAAVLRTLSTPLGVKTLANLSVGSFLGSSSAIGLTVTSPDVSDQAPQLGGTGALSGFSTINNYLSTGVAWFMSAVEVRTNLSSQVRTRFSVSAAADRLGVVTRGWTYIR